jgi:MFS family permease
MQTQSTEQKNSNSKTSVTKVRVNWRKLLPFLIISITTGTMIQSVAAYFSLYAVDQLGIAVTTAALLMAVRPAVGLFAGPFGGYLSDRIGSVPVIIVVSFLAIPLIYLIGVVPNILAFIAVMIVSGIFSYTRGAASEAYIVGYTPEYRRSTILGIYFFANAEISGLLTPVIGILIDWIGFSSSFTVVSITLAVIVLISSMFIWKGRGQTGKDAESR